MIRLPSILTLFFFNDTATTEIYTLSLHDALPIFAVCVGADQFAAHLGEEPGAERHSLTLEKPCAACTRACCRSEEHTSVLQSLAYLVCRLLLEKKKNVSTTSLHCTDLSVQLLHDS